MRVKIASEHFYHIQRCEKKKDVKKCSRKHLSYDKYFVATCKDDEKKIHIQSISFTHTKSAMCAHKLKCE